jgi:hypothetical protein
MTSELPSTSTQDNVPSQSSFPAPSPSTQPGFSPPTHYERVPASLIGHWKGTVAAGDDKLIVDIVIQQTDLGQSAGSFNAAGCEYATSLLDASGKSIEFSISGIGNPRDCYTGYVGVVKLNLINDRMIKYAYRGSSPSTEGVLQRYAE